MSREKEMYRENLAMLTDVFTGKQLLSPKDVSKWAGRDWRTMQKHYFGVKKYITIPELASKIS